MITVGYASLHAVERPGSPVSPEAEVVRIAAHQVVGAEERSLALFGPKAEAISEIWALLNEYGEDWDGEGAEPVSEIAAHTASDFIRALPNDIPLPELAPEPDGSISLDWMQSRNRVFSLSAGSSSRLAYAWLDGADRGHAVARFGGDEVPPRILDGIRRIASGGTATVRPS